MKRIATLTDEEGRVTGVVHGPDFVDQKIKVRGQEWHFDYDLHHGPLWLRKDGMERRCQNPHIGVWKALARWAKERDV